MNTRQFYSRRDVASPPPPLALRPRKAAEVLGISESTLDRLTRAGAIPHAKVGSIVLYPTAALKRWLADRTADVKGGDVA